MGIIFTFLKKYRVASIAALIMMLVELAVELMQPLLIAKIIDEGIMRQNLSVVWLWGGILTISSILAFMAGIASSFFASHASQGFGYDLRARLYDKVQSFTYAVFNRFAASSLITRLTGDVGQVQELVFMSLRFMTRVPLVVAGSMIMALIIHVRLGLLLVIMVPALLVFVIWVIKKSAQLFSSVQERLDSVNGVIQENLTGMRLIRVFVRMSHESNRFVQACLKLMKSTVSALRLTETTMPFIMLVMNAGIIAVLWFGRADIASGDATVGQVVAVMNYSLRTIGALSAFAWLIVSFSRARASTRRINEVFAADGEGNEVFQDGKLLLNVTGGVEFDRVGFQYPGGEVSVLKDVSFTARPGERIAIMGATGAGKSSLVQLITRLYEEQEGTVRIDGVDARKLNVVSLREAIGYVPQEVLLFTGTVRDNIAWGLENASFEQIVEAAKQAQIHETIERLPDGYDTMLGQRGVNLSGGQKQRLSIARALVRNPSILILDDSTSALDVRTEAALLDALTSLSCTTFLITQKISSTASADLILLIDEGRLIDKGTHNELITASSLYRQIYESQYRKEDVPYVQSTS
ncbi:ABC transporter ATP-binding protein [Paenibacillus eucommiae]|uniref:ATP-binding cassette subfamily B protein n=1 Tax=Paenibacillus eucommiae TaxID=1355755 RepID=A0ABS4IQ51_9BACL|nr:ABC transporter ATP-binding protein [Paenibacillus eucommiae]MBP1989700.1 ATP-binding cassette subfamily B protein [Paenibacillus eucommiae]